MSAVDSVDPIERFRATIDEAMRIPRDVMPEPNAFALATVSADGAPSVRIVLLKTVDERGFVFYTNFESRKGQELLATQRAALCFHWPTLELQVRVEGRAERVSEAEADEYFASRARESDRSLGVAAESPDGEPWRSGPACPRDRSALRRRRRATPTALVGFSRSADADRVLERNAEQAPRQRGVHPPRGW